MTSSKKANLAASSEIEYSLYLIGMANEENKMYFTSLKVKNVRSFGEEQELNLLNDDGTVARWTLILGDNGVGKTTLLKCLAWMVPVERPPLKTDESALNEEMDENRKQIILKPYMDDLEESNFEHLIRIGHDIKTEITVTVSNGVALKDITSNESLVSVGIGFEKHGNKLTVITPKYGEIASYNPPNIFAYSANRHLAYKNIESSDLKDPISNLFSDSGDLYDAEQLLSMLDTASIRQNKKGKATDLLAKIKEILVDILPDIKDVNSILINSPINEDGSINKDLVEVQTADGRVKLLNLSLGYVTMLTWIVDLAVRMLWRFPTSDEPLKEPAMVLVDEIDLHLHPIWQRTIMRKLTHHFSETQFICTAHSPIMAQASESQNLVVVRRQQDDNIIIENEPYIVRGWRIGQLLTSELFDFESDRAPEITEKMERRRALLKEAHLTEVEKNELTSLNLEIEQLPIGETKEEITAANMLKEFAKNLQSLKRKDD